MTSIGEQIAAARKAKGMTQDALAAAMHMSRQGISHWETGRTLPDAEALLRLSSLLNYQFEMPEKDDSGEGAPDDPGAPMQTDQEEAESAEADKRPARKKLIFCVTAAVCILLAACLILIPRSPKQEEKDVFTAPNGVRYAIADFDVTAAREEGKAYLTVVPRLEIRNPGENAFNMYTFFLREENGIPITLNKLECVQFYANGVAVDAFNKDEMKAVELDPEIPALGSFEYIGGQPAFRPDKKRNGIGIGFRVDGVDGNGAALTFTGYLPLPRD